MPGPTLIATEEPATETVTTPGRSVYNLTSEQFAEVVRTGFATYGIPVPAGTVVSAWEASTGWAISLTEPSA